MKVSWGIESCVYQLGTTKPQKWSPESQIQAGSAAGVLSLMHVLRQESGITCLNSPSSPTAAVSEPLSGEFAQSHHSRLVIALFLLAPAMGTVSSKKLLKASMTSSSRLSDVPYCRQTGTQTCCTNVAHKHGRNHAAALHDKHLDLMCLLPQGLTGLPQE